MAHRWRIITTLLGIMLYSLPAWTAERLVFAHTPTILAGLISLAQENGYFQEEGLDVVVETFSTGALAQQSLLAGKADVADVADIPFMLASFQEPDLVLFATIGTSDNNEKLVVRTDRGIQSARDLRGHAVGIQDRTSFHYFLSLVLLKYGLQESDLQVVIKKAHLLADALAKGEIDAFACREPVISEAERLLGKGMHVLEEPGLYQKSMNLVSKRGFLEKRPESAVKLLRALLKAENFYRKQRATAVALLSKRLAIPLDKLEPELVDARLRLTLSQELLYILEHEAAWAIQQGWAKGGAIPNYLPLLHTEAMKWVKPSAITLVK